MSDYDRWRNERDRSREMGDRDRDRFSSRSDRGYGEDRYYGRDDRDYGQGRHGRDDDDWRRREREPGAMDVAFGRGMGSNYEGRDMSGRGQDRSRYTGGDNDYYGGFYGADQGYGRGRSDRPSQGGYGRGDYGARDYGRGGSRDYTRSYDDRDVTGYRGERGFLDRAGDEISSWFGDDEAARRRERDAAQGDQGAQHHGGRGPRNYQRSDERICDDVNDRLTDDRQVDATEIEVTVQGREVTLNGTVNNRYDKRRAEDIAESVSGVTHVQNNLRVRQSSSMNTGGLGGERATSSTGQPSTAGTSSSNFSGVGMGRQEKIGT
ncbi:BON domain-containing protein [Methylobacterium sp. CB376]|uniref:BON domain-containing protein n=1 Tax=unclassified Methylobacterium TaxID=2615210 RepID=UPI000A2F0897|nr:MULTISPECIES: BON domain-containing protein [Methylobacterium]WFT78277.1 BON domain-containing protein [Methylobacterium nodulans]